MKFFLVLAVVVACASADVSHVVNHEADAAVVKAEYGISPEGAFRYAVETSNGIYAQASGSIKNPGAEYPTLEVSGGYKYTSPEGYPVELTYTADEQGYKPVGSHLPVSPPIPEVIARALAYIASHSPPPPTNARV